MRDVEWDFVLGFTAFLILWLIVGHQLLYDLAVGNPLFGGPQATIPHPILAYGIFIVIYCVMFFMIGQSIHKGLMAMGLGIIGYFIVDIWTPPIVIASGINMKMPLLVLVGSMILLGSIIFFIISNRYDIQYKLYIFLGLLVLGILFLGFGSSYVGDPFVKDCVTLMTPYDQMCHMGKSAVLPGNLNLASDTFFYLLMRNSMGLPHILAWIGTYIILPMSAITLLAVFLTKDEIGDAVMD